MTSHPFSRSRLLLPLVLCVAACFCVAADNPAPASKQDGKKVTVTEKDNGGETCLARGDVLVVRLEAQYGTGYGWSVVKYEREVLEQLGEPEQESPGRGRPGSVEHQVYRFKALAAGSTSLELHYLRPWEKDKQPLKTYKINVSID